MGNRDAIIELFRRLGEVKGKKALQKLVYLARIFGIETGYSYRFHYYGPYSDALAQDLDILLESNVVGIKPNTRYTLILNENNQSNTSISGSDSLKIDKLIHSFGKMSPSDLEIYATAYFVDRNEKYVFNNWDEEEIINEIAKAKPKFDEEYIRLRYSELKNWGFLFKASV